MSNPTFQTLPPGYVYVAQLSFTSLPDCEVLGAFDTLNAAMHACHKDYTLYTKDRYKRMEGWDDEEGWLGHARRNVSWYPDSETQYDIRLFEIQK